MSKQYEYYINQREPIDIEGWYPLDLSRLKDINDLPRLIEEGKIREFEPIFYNIKQGDVYAALLWNYKVIAIDEEKQVAFCKHTDASGSVSLVRFDYLFKLKKLPKDE